MSKTSTSLENRFSRRPAGVTSKKPTGVRITFVSIRLWRMRPAFSAPTYVASDASHTVTTANTHPPSYPICTHLRSGRWHIHYWRAPAKSDIGNLLDIGVLRLPTLGSAGAPPQREAIQVGQDKLSGQTDGRANKSSTKTKRIPKNLRSPHALKRAVGKLEKLLLPLLPSVSHAKSCQHTERYES